MVSKENPLIGILKITSTIKETMVEPIKYIQGAYWELEQEKGPAKAKTLAFRIASALMVGPDIISLGIILHSQLLFLVGSIITGAESTSMLATWFQMKQVDNHHIRRTIEGPRQPRLFFNL